MDDKTEAAGLALLRKPFPPHQISKLPKPTKKQTDEVKADFRKGIRCSICGTWHHPNAVHLDYVGHAALTDRLLDCDPEWNWEPAATRPDGSPAMDEGGGLWIKLTVCGVTRLGYGHADGKRGGDAIKEAIGDALRNAAMRFGAALDLWHKGDLHLDDGDGSADPDARKEDYQPDHTEHVNRLAACDTLAELRHVWSQFSRELHRVPEILAAKDKRKAELEADAEHDKAVKDADLEADTNFLNGGK